MWIYEPASLVISLVWFSCTFRFSIICILKFCVNLQQIYMKRDCFCTKSISSR